MSTVANKIKQLKALRSVSMERMTDMKLIAESAKANSNFISQLKARATQLEAIYHDFNTHHNSLITLTSTIEDYNLVEEEAIRKLFDECYYTVISIQYDLFDDKNSPNVSGDLKSNVKLPQIELVRFDGDPKKWRTFIDSFDALVHNSSLTNIEKFNYLISTLSGPPLALVKCNRLSDATYMIAYDSLKSRYEDKRAMATAHYLELEKAVKISDTNVTSQNLRHLLEVYEENLAALKNMKFPTSEWDFVIFNMLLNRLDSNTISRFEVEHSSNDIPKLEHLTAFVRRQCNALDRAAEITPNKVLNKADNLKQRNYSPKPGFSSNQRPHSSFFTQTRGPIACPFCKRDHLIYRCTQFLALSPQERYNTAKSNKWCINCLGVKHSLKDCTSISRCMKCHQKHHTHLHFEQVANPTNDPQLSTFTPNNNPNTTQQNVTSLTNMVPALVATKSTTLLATALVEVFDSLQNVHILRILIDSGSQVNFISEKCCNRLGSRQRHISLSILGLGHMNSKASKSVSVTFRPCKRSEPIFSIDAVVLTQICDNMPQFTIPHDSWSHITNLNLADPKFHTPSPIDLLLGADTFPMILRSGRLVGQKDEPIAIETALGWILMGSVYTPLSSLPLNSFFCNCDVSLERSLTRFWEVENIPKSISLSADEELCESLYMQNVSRSISGRFTVALPFLTSDPIFPEIRNIAQRRFLTLERRLLRDPPLYKQYCDFMQDFLSSGHMALLESPTISDDVYYIPHHSVINLNSSTTKLRVVFDASCKSANGLSLNDSLLTGPKLQRDLFNILLNFRAFKIAFTADIRQMYRQINVVESHKKYQRIFWRFAPEKPLQEFTLNTVTYGVSSAPYLAIKTLLHLADLDGSNFPLAAEALRSYTYVDDLVISIDSLDKAKLLKTQLISLLRRGGFELHKWVSNDPSLIPVSNTEQVDLSLDLDSDANMKVLGLRWNYSRDIFSFQVNTTKSICTKRTILSELAKIFDPLGFLTPLTFFAKRLIQHLWTLGLDWDDTPPVEVVDSWNQYKIELFHLSEISIPRHILTLNYSSVELHGFSDASKRGYAAVVYLRVQASNQVTITFVCAKSKVSPLKLISIPRLELCAAVLLSELVSSIINSYRHKIQFNKIIAWTDSTIALSWIRSEPYKFPVFVSNRITQIQEKLSPNIWRYIPSADNPADCASRGLSSSSQLVHHPLWWAGPSWLSANESAWPQLPDLSSPSLLEEEKCVVFTAATPPDNFLETLINNHSSISKIQRIVAYVHRFIFNISNPTKKNVKPLFETDLNDALFTLIKHVQQHVFASEIANLKRKTPLSKPFRKLNPFLDTRGLLRVGGRLSNSRHLYDKRFPIFLPRDHRLTTLLIESTHKQYLHPGVQTLHFILSQRFWIFSAKKIIRRVISKCRNCWRLNPTPYQPPMGNLPSFRISQVKPFSVVGVDFCGPYWITLGKVRTAKKLKAYVSVFVCFTTKALHLELVSDLSSDAFMAALRRFLARRGRCSYIFSDCGTNFVGAARELSQKMQAVACEEKLHWHFNPPSSPHFGGLWEAGVKSVKTHISRVIGEQLLTYEELNTLLVQVEAILNSRPLCAVSADPNDLSVLTPGHFLTLEPLNSLPDDNLQHLKLNRLSRWQLIQRLHQDFWTRWSKEYLHTLHQRSKWNVASAPALPGTVVLIQEDNVPPLRWRMGRILETHPGSDGISRVATVRTSSGTFKRPLVKLCALPMESKTT